MRPHLLLLHAAEGEAQELQLRVRRGEEEVALIARPVDRPVERGPVRPRHAPHVVAGGERVRPQIAGDVQQIAELDALVAAHAGDRRLAAQVRVGEILDHRLAEAGLVVEHVVTDAEPVGDPAGVVDVLAGATGAGPSPLGARRIELQRDADDLVAGLRQQGGGDRRIDAAGHGDDHARAAAKAEIDGGYRHGAHYRDAQGRRKMRGLRRARNTISMRDSPGLSGIKWDKWDSVGQGPARPNRPRLKGRARAR